MLLSCWLQHKSWAELGALRSEVQQCRPLGDRYL